MDNLQKLKLRGIKISFLIQIITALIGFIKIPLLTYYLAPKDFGLLAISASITGIIHLLKDFGYGTYVIKEENVSFDEQCFLYSRIILLSFIAFVITSISSIPLSWFYGSKELYWIMPITGFQFIFNGLVVIPIALLNKDLAFNKIAKVEVISSISSFLIGLIVLFFFKNYWVLLLINISYFLIQWIYLLLTGAIKCKWYNPLDKEMGKKSFKYGSALTFFNILTFVSTNLDNFIIGKVAGTSALGIYNRAYEFGVVMLERVRKPVQQVYFSAITKNRNNAIRYLFDNTLLLLTILLCILVPFFIFLPFVVENYLDKSWADLFSLIKPFLLTSVVWIPMAMLDQLLLIKQNVRPYMFLGMIKAIVGMIAIGLSSYFGVNAIAWAFFIYHIIIVVPFIFYSFRCFGLKGKELVYYSCQFLFFIFLFEMPLILLSHLQSFGHLKAVILIVILLYGITFSIWLSKKNQNFRYFSYYLTSFFKRRVPDVC